MRERERERPYHKEVLHIYFERKRTATNLKSANRNRLTVEQSGTYFCLTLLQLEQAALLLVFFLSPPPPPPLSFPAFVVDPVPFPTVAFLLFGPGPATAELEVVGLCCSSI